MLETAPDFIVHCKVPIQTLVADHENAVEQHSHDVADIRGAGQLFTAFLREHSEEGDRDVLQVPTDDHGLIAREHLAKLAERQTSFANLANALCSRDDVSADTVAKARDELNDLVERKLDEFAEEREEIRKRAIDAYKHDRTWSSEVISVTATSPINDDLNVEGLV
jgi:hypothetical protein